MSDLHHYRKSYEKSALDERGLPTDPMALFDVWFAETDASELVDEANAMTLSTIGPDGFPRSRVVLLKSFSAEGFVFFTNYRSEKGRAIAVNPHVCLSFFWPPFERQVIIKGIAEKTTDKVSDDYFNTRPEASRLGAIASPQSEIVPSRAFLDDRLKAIQASGAAIQRPEHWGGYLIRPIEVEFWQGRANRMHDRMRYRKQEADWLIERLAP